MARILLAFDGSDGALGAVTALSHWPLAGSDLTLLTVTSAGAPPSPRLAHLRESAARALRRRGASVTLALSGGEPAEETLNHAFRINADLVVMGPRKRPAISQLVLGSVTADVLRHAVSPVLIGRLSLAAERCVVVLDSAEDLAAITRGWPSLPLPPGLEISLVGLPSPIPRADVPSAMRHVLPQAIPRAVSLAEESRLQEVLDRGRAFFEARGLTVDRLMLPPRAHDVEEVLSLEARLAPELLAMHRPTPDDERALVARARSSVLLFP